jgi:hypothetical protein
MSGASAQESFEISLRGASNIGEDALAAKLLDGFTFEGGYTDTVSKGDGDLTTADTLWDFKVSKAKVKKSTPCNYLCTGGWACIRFIPSFKASNI